MDHPLAGAVGPHEVGDHGALVGRDHLAVFGEFAQQLFDDLVAPAALDVEVRQIQVGHDPGPQLLAVLPPDGFVHVEPGAHQRPVVNLLGDHLRASGGPLQQLITPARRDSQPHLLAEIRGDFMKTQPHFVPKGQREFQGPGTQLGSPRQRLVAVLGGQLAPVDLPAALAQVLKQHVPFDLAVRRDDILDDDLFGLARGGQGAVAVVALVLDALYFLVDLVGNFAMGPLVALLSPRLLLRLPVFPFLARVGTRLRPVPPLPLLDDAGLLFDGLPKVFNELFKLGNTLAKSLVIGRHNHCRSCPAKDWNPGSTTQSDTIPFSLKYTRKMLRLSRLRPLNSYLQSRCQEEGIKMEINRKVLSDALTHLVKVVPKKSTMYILKNVHIQCEAKKATLTVTDLKTWVQFTLPYTGDPVNTCVDAAVLYKLVNIGTDKNNTVKIDENGDDCSIICDGARSRLKANSIDLYPSISVNDCVEIGSLISKEFVKASKFIVPAVSIN